MEEIWRDIRGFEGRYQVSNLGNVKSLRYNGTDNAKNLVPKRNNTGRLWVELVYAGEKRCALIHRLVAEAFIPNPQNYPQINHIDENPQNNVVENLEWCDGSYNVRYSIARHPERNEYRKRKRENTRPYKHNCEVIQYSKAGEAIGKYINVLTLCRENNWRTSSIIDCCNGKRKSAYGYIWRFAS